MPGRQGQIAGLLGALAALVVGCGVSPTATPPPSQTPAPAGLTRIVLVADNSLGGLSANTRTTTIDATTGTFTVEKTDAAPVEGALSRDDLTALATLVADVGFFALQENYIPEDGTCCDLVAYSITVTQDGRVHSVRASDSNMPEGFRTLLGRIQALTEG